MTFKDFKDNLLDLIQKNKLEQTIRALSNSSFIDEEDNSEFISLSARVKEYKKLKHSGKIAVAVQELSIFHAQITDALTYFVNNLEDKHIQILNHDKKNENMQSSTHKIPKEVQELSTPKGLELFKKEIDILQSEDHPIKNISSKHPHYELVIFLYTQKKTLASAASKKVFLDKKTMRSFKTDIITFLDLLDDSIINQSVNLIEFLDYDFSFSLKEYEKALNHINNIIPPKLNSSLPILTEKIEILKATLKRMLH